MASEKLHSLFCGFVFRSSHSSGRASSTPAISAGIPGYVEYRPSLGYWTRRAPEMASSRRGSATTYRQSAYSSPPPSIPAINWSMLDAVLIIKQRRHTTARRNGKFIASGCHSRSLTGPLHHSMRHAPSVHISLVTYTLCLRIRILKKIRKYIEYGKKIIRIN